MTEDMYYLNIDYQLNNNADTASKPTINTKYVLKRPLYLFRLGTLYMAMVGITNKIIAMIGPEIASIIPRILGLITAQIQIVTNITVTPILSAVALPSLVCFVTRPLKLSRAPKK